MFPPQISGVYDNNVAFLWKNNLTVSLIKTMAIPTAYKPVYFDEENKRKILVVNILKKGIYD